MYSGPSYPAQTFQPAEQTQRNNFYTRQASHLVGRLVRINRGGHDSVEGVLVAIPSDYLVVLTVEGIVYVNGAHVKSITEGAQESEGKSGGGRSGGSRSGGSRSGGNRSRDGRSRSFVSASSFQSLLQRLRYKHIQINRGGPEKLDGFLAEIASDNVLLVVDRELVRIPTFHIKTVTISGKNQNQNQNQNKNNNKSGGNKNKSGGNKNKSGNKSNSKRSGGGKGGRGSR